MKKEEKASISAVKIIIISFIFILFSGIGVMAVNSQINNVKVQFPNNYELSILTTKTNVGEILKDNHISVGEEEAIEPALDEDIGPDKIIKITQSFEETDDTQAIEALSTEDIFGDYSTVVEKIETMEVEIPYETITKDVSGGNTENNQTKVIQEGQNGLKQIVYKITYKDNIEIDRIELSSTVIKEPVNKIVQVSKKTTISRSSTSERTGSNPSTTSTSSLAKKVANITPEVKTLNASAYTASTCGKSVTDSGYGRTASGSMAQSWYTVAAGKGYPIGTVIYIPYFKDKPNGGWFVVQDRGSAISNSKIDIYMDSYNDCKKFGRRNLECYIYKL